MLKYYQMLGVHVIPIIFICSLRYDSFILPIILLQIMSGKVYLWPKENQFLAKFFNVGLHFIFSSTLVILLATTRHSLQPKPGKAKGTLTWSSGPVAWAAKNQAFWTRCYGSFRPDWLIRLWQNLCRVFQMFSIAPLIPRFPDNEKQDGDSDSTLTSGTCSDNISI